MSNVNLFKAWLAKKGETIIEGGFPSVNDAYHWLQMMYRAPAGRKADYAAIINTDMAATQHHKSPFVYEADLNSDDRLSRMVTRQPFDGLGYITGAAFGRPSLKSLKLIMSEAHAKEWLKVTGSPDSEEDDHGLVDKALDLAANFMGGEGVESVTADVHVDGYYQNIVGLYVSLGDSYATTLLYDTEIERFYVTSVGDWIELQESKGRYQFD